MNILTYSFPTMPSEKAYKQRGALTATGQQIPLPEQDPNVRVMVVEDHEDSRAMLKTMLEINGDISVVEAVDGEMAITLSETMHFDLILTDCRLPLMDGFDVTRSIRHGVFMPSVPIIFLSGYDDPATRDKAFAAGCDDYLVKPFDIDELCNLMKRHLSQDKANSLP